MPSPPLVQHFRSVPEYLTAFTAYAIAHLPHLTPADIPDGHTLGATFRLSPAALAGLPVNLWRSSDWDEYKQHTTSASDPATATAHSLAHQQLPAEIFHAAATLDSSFLANAPASGSPADAKPEPGPDSDADDPAPDDLAQPKAGEPKAGPGAPARSPLPARRKINMGMEMPAMSAYARTTYSHLRVTACLPVASSARDRASARRHPTPRSS